jgi:hypothetical protein
MKLDTLSLESVGHVARNMRQRDKDEIYATRWNEDPESLAKAVVSCDPFALVACSDDGEPVCVFGVHEMWPGVFSVFMFATDRWNEVSLSVTKHALRFMIPCVMSERFVRAECRSMSTHTQAHRWLETLGAYKESEHACYGKNGETFFTYVWTKQPTKTN